MEGREGRKEGGKSTTTSLQTNLSLPNNIPARRDFQHEIIQYFGSFKALMLYICQLLYNYQRWWYRIRRVVTPAGINKLV